MPELSAGLVMFDVRDQLKIFLVHPGGPYFKNKDQGWWSIPKGLIEPAEDFQSAAIREFQEETGISPKGPYLDLGSIRQKSGKTVFAWAFQGDSTQPIELKSNTFEIEWPPRSGRNQEFPEIDQAQWYLWESAVTKIMEAQVPLLQRLKQISIG